MAFCKMCGQEMADDAVVCNYCGAPKEASQEATQEATQEASQATSQATSQEIPQPTVQTTAPQETDEGGFLWGLLGCCIPIVGLVLFLVWKDNKPKTAKALGIGALVSVIATVLFYVIYFVFIFVLAASGSF